MPIFGEAELGIESSGHECQSCHGMIALEVNVECRAVAMLIDASIAQQLSVWARPPCRPIPDLLGKLHHLLCLLMAIRAPRQDASDVCLVRHPPDQVGYP